MNRRSGALVLALAALAGCAAPRIEDGRAAYLRNCADCHGPAGQGDGGLSGLVPGGVPDLTGLSARNGGAFPYADTVRLIDRGSAVHGRLVAMPDFGGLLAGPRARYRAPDGSTVETAAAVLDIVDYLESVQTGAPPAADPGR